MSVLDVSEGNKIEHINRYNPDSISLSNPSSLVINPATARFNHIPTGFRLMKVSITMQSLRGIVSHGSQHDVVIVI